MKKILPLVVIFLIYVICLNLDWNGLLGTTMICMTMTWFILNKLEKVEEKMDKKEGKKKDKDDKWYDKWYYL